MYLQKLRGSSWVGATSMSVNSEKQLSTVIDQVKRLRKWRAFIESIFL